jgi:hypothetical protein
MVQVLRELSACFRCRHGKTVRELRKADKMMSQPDEGRTTEPSGDGIDSIEHLIRWIARRTAGRARVLQRLAEVKQAQREIHRLREALCLLSRELGALYPQGPIINLARRRVRDAVLSLAHHPQRDPCGS